jgi:TetR/AcrR family transcriptional regulator, cholesterol catabolism regulator
MGHTLRSRTAGIQPTPPTVKPASAANPKRRGRPPKLPATASDPMPAGDTIRDAVARLKRDRIVAAAVDLFYRQGYERTTLEEVADALNVTKPFIYAHFASKADLLAEICSRAIRHVHGALNQILTQADTCAERLERIVREFLLAVLDNQPHAVIYSREETELKPADRDAINGLRRSFDRKLVELLEAGVQAGEFKIQDIGVTALAIGGIVGWAPVWYRPNGRLGKAELTQKLAALVLNMVQAGPTSTRKAGAQKKPTLT